MFEMIAFFEFLILILYYYSAFVEGQGAHDIRLYLQVNSQNVITSIIVIREILIR